MYASQIRTWIGFAYCIVLLVLGSVVSHCTIRCSERWCLVTFAKVLIWQTRFTSTLPVSASTLGRASSRFHSMDQHSLTHLIAIDTCVNRTASRTQVSSRMLSTCWPYELHGKYVFQIEKTCRIQQIFADIVIGGDATALAVGTEDATGAGLASAYSSVCIVHTVLRTRSAPHKLVQTPIFHRNFGHDHGK